MKPGVFAGGVSRLERTRDQNGHLQHTFTTKQAEGKRELFGFSGKLHWVFKTKYGKREERCIDSEYNKVCFN